MLSLNPVLFISYLKVYRTNISSLYANYHRNTTKNSHKLNALREWVHGIFQIQRSITTESDHLVHFFQAKTYLFKAILKKLRTWLLLHSNYAWLQRAYHKLNQTISTHIVQHGYMFFHSFSGCVKYSSFSFELLELKTEMDLWPTFLLPFNRNKPFPCSHEWHAYWCQFEWRVASVRDLSV